jgi:hypothetical protein
MATEKIKQFNEILSSFLIQISPLIGSDYHYKVEQIIKYNSLLPIEQFLTYALPLRDKILKRDETYFNDDNNCPSDIKNDHQTLSEILRLKDIYYKIDSTSKDNVWDIFQALLILGEEYIQIKVIKM